MDNLYSCSNYTLKEKMESLILNCINTEIYTMFKKHIKCFSKNFVHKKQSLFYFSGNFCIRVEYILTICGEQEVTYIIVYKIFCIIILKIFQHGSYLFQFPFQNGSLELISFYIPHNVLRITLFTLLFYILVTYWSDYS